MNHYLKNIKRFGGGLFFLVLKLICNVPSHALRKLFLKSLGAKIGDKVAFYSGAEIRRPSALSIGSGTSIGHDAVLDARNGLKIGNNVNLSSQVMIWSMQHDYRSKFFDVIGGMVTIEDYAWLGPRVIVLPGVTIGRGAVVAAGAVVTKDILPYTVVAGVPATKIRDRPKDMSYIPGEYPLPFC